MSTTPAPTPSAQSPSAPPPRPPAGSAPPPWGPFPPAVPPTRRFDPQPTAPAPSRGASVLTPNAEGLGYAGGVLITLAVGYLLSGVWQGLGGAWQAALTLLATVSLGGAAVVVGEDDPIARRLSTTLWVLAGTSATFTSYLLVAEVAGLQQDAAGLAAGVVMAAGAGTLWQRLGSPALGVVTHVGITTAVFSAAGFVSGDDLVVRGMAVWLAACAWLVGGLVDERLRHGALTSVGALTAIAAAQSVVLGDRTGLLLAIPTIGLLTGLAVHPPTRAARVWLGFSLVVFVPQAAMLLPEDIAWPVLMLVSGIAMVGTCAALVRRRRRDALSTATATTSTPAPPAGTRAGS